MITAQTIRERMAKKPFSPFRIVSSSGQTYEVLHSELVMVGKNVIGVAKPISADDIDFAYVDVVSVLHITALETLQQPSQRP